MNKTTTTQRVKAGNSYSILTIEKWEDENYEYMSIDSTKEKGGTIDTITERFVQNIPEALARLTFWQREGAALTLPTVQAARNAGYEPVLQLGPECLKVSTTLEQSKGFLRKAASAVMYHWTLVGFTITFQRKKS